MLRGTPIDHAPLNESYSYCPTRQWVLRPDDAGLRRAESAAI
jgi:hypothetical protein